MTRGTYGTQNGKDKPAGKSGKVGADDNAPFVGYINLNLSAEQKAAFDAWRESASPFEQLEYQVADGVNLSVRREVKTGGFMASATQRRVDSPNAGLVVTARAREATTSLLRVLFCLTVLSQHERWTDTQPVADPDRW